MGELIREIKDLKDGISEAADDLRQSSQRQTEAVESSFESIQESNEKLEVLSGAVGDLNFTVLKAGCDVSSGLNKLADSVSGPLSDSIMTAGIHVLAGLFLGGLFNLQAKKMEMALQMRAMQDADDRVNPDIIFLSNGMRASVLEIKKSLIKILREASDQASTEELVGRIKSLSKEQMSHILEEMITMHALRDL